MLSLSRNAETGFGPPHHVRLVGWAVIDGGTSTVNTATALVREPAVLVTTTV